MKGRRRWLSLSLALTVFALAASAAGADSGLLARPQLRFCGGGLPRPFRCGHVVVPMRRADPTLGAASANQPSCALIQPGCGRSPTEEAEPGRLVGVERRLGLERVGGKLEIAHPGWTT